MIQYQDILAATEKNEIEVIYHFLLQMQEKYLTNFLQAPK